MTCKHSIHLCQCKDGHPSDKEEVCIKCGEKFAELRWNGKYLDKKNVMGSGKIMGKK